MYMLYYRILVIFFASMQAVYPCFFLYLCIGIVLVHDLTNRKSHQNLRKWLAEILNKDTLRSQGNG